MKNLIINLINTNYEITNDNLTNCIIAEVEIKEKDINRDIRKINYYEESLRINKNINRK